MGFAGKWLVGTLAVLVLVLLVSFVVPIKYGDPAPVLHVYNVPGQRRLARNRCKEYYDAAHLWRTVKRRYPSSLKEMEAPLRAGEGNYMRIAKDPWGNEYHLEIDGPKLRVWSWGHDAQEGTDDDISYPEID